METSLQSGSLDTTLGDLAKLLKGELEGDPLLRIRRLTSAENGEPEGIAFAELPRYVDMAVESGVGALILAPGTDARGIPAIRVDQPRLAFFSLLQQTDRKAHLDSGIHPTAVVSPLAKVAADASVGPYSVIEAHAIVGANAKVFAFAYIGEFCTVGEGAVIGPHAVLFRNAEVGARTVIHPGAVLGADGFGFVWDGKNRIKIPQVGRVLLGNDVEIGANSTIDRATAGATTIGDGTKIDNLVQIGHNAAIGDDCAIAALSGISGSTRIGDRVVMGGQVATVDHVVIPDDVMLGGRSGVTHDLPGPGRYFGAPAAPASEGMRSFLLIPKLGELFSRIRKAEKRLEKLETERLEGTE